MLLNSINSFITPKASLRGFSFFGRFCKKTVKGKKSDGAKASIQLKNAFKLYNLETEPSSTADLDQPLASNLYTQMQTIRRMENACAKLYRDKTIRGFCHLYVGQEACCAGIKSCMRSQDTVITSYRAHAWTYIMGRQPYSLIAELCQKQTGCSRGKGGSMHTYAPNFFGGNGIVGGQVPLGAGIALTHAYRCDGGVNFTCYGDGAANQGQVHEAFNMACLMKLPIIFVCENNKYAMGTASKRSACSTNFYTRGDYIPGLWVNGNDVLAVRNATQFAIDYVNKCGPLVMELETYRYYGHSLSDPGTSYRTREEVQMMREKNDPILKFKEMCLKHKIIKEEEFKKIDDDIKVEIDGAVKQTLKDKESNISELATDVYVKNLEGKIRNIRKRDLKHHNVGTRFIPEGTVKATPQSQIKELTKETETKQVLPDAKTENNSKAKKSKDIKPPKKGK